MNKQTKITIFLAASIALGNMFPVSSLFAQETPTMLMEQVTKMGSTWVVSELWNKQSEWDRVMNGIASGQEPWVELAIALYPGSDAGQLPTCTMPCFKPSDKTLPTYCAEPKRNIL